MFMKVKIQLFAKTGWFGYCSNINLSVCRGKKLCIFSFQNIKGFVGVLLWIKGMMSFLTLSSRPILVILRPGEWGFWVGCSVTQGAEQARSEPNPDFKFLERSIQSTEQNCKELPSVL